MKHCHFWTVYAYEICQVVDITIWRKLLLMLWFYIIGSSYLGYSSMELSFQMSVWVRYLPNCYCMVLNLTREDSSVQLWLVQQDIWCWSSYKLYLFHFSYTTWYGSKVIEEVRSCLEIDSYPIASLILYTMIYVHVLYVVYIRHCIKFIFWFFQSW
jgi:hypothetical protein